MMIKCFLKKKSKNKIFNDILNEDDENFFINES